MQQYQLDKTIDFILAGQQANGCFPTYEYYPVIRPQDGWNMLPDSSPFIVANLLYCLLEIGDSRCETAIKGACGYLEKTIEFGGYFRFWPHMSQQHPIPMDMDDTGISSYVLQRCGRKLDNKEALMNNVNSKGYLLTWLQPSWRLWFAKPSAALGLTIGSLQGIPTRILKYLHYNDAEPAVAANGLLYLKESQRTKRCIHAIIDEVLGFNFPIQYYEDELVVYYHIARAYKHSVPSFEALKETITWRIQKRFEQSFDSANDVWLCMAANTLMDFDADYTLAERLVNKVAAGPMCPDKWLSVPYFCSTDRNFMAGSPQYTAAVYAEAVVKLLRHKQGGSHA